MKRAAVFFDRDNTLIASDGYLGEAHKVVLIEGAPDAVARARSYGFVAVTFSNQSGVARGMFSETDVEAVNRRMDELLLASNARAVFSRHEYCPFHPDAPLEKYRQESPLRKPRPGMLLAAAEKLNLDLNRSWVIGDAPRDIEAGKAAGCRTILFTHPELPASPAASEESAATPDFTASSLKECVEIIGREMHKNPNVRPATARMAATPVAARIAEPVGTPVAATAAAVMEDSGDESPAMVTSRGEESDDSENSESIELTQSAGVELDEEVPAPMVSNEVTAGSMNTGSNAFDSGSMSFASFSSLDGDAGMLLPPDDQDSSFDSFSASAASMMSETSASTALMEPPARVEPEMHQTPIAAPVMKAAPVTAAAVAPPAARLPEVKPEPVKNVMPSAPVSELAPRTEPSPISAPQPSAPVAPIATVAPVTQITVSTAKLESLVEQLLTELKGRREEPNDFSVSKLLAGIVQVLALAALAYAFLLTEGHQTQQMRLLLAVFLQTFTVALLIMGRQK